MKFKSTYIIGILFLALAAYVYFVEIVGEEKRLEEEKNKDLIFIFDFDSVNELNVIRGDSSFTCEKRGEDWWLTEPVNYKAHNSTVSSTISLFKSAKNENLVTETGENLDRYGLGSSAPRMKITFLDGMEKTLVIGDKNPTESHIYAKLEDSPEVYLTNSSLHSKLREPLINFRYKKVMHSERKDVDRFIVREHGQEITISKKEPGSTEWKIESPIETNADNGRVGIVLDKLFTADIKLFADENPSGLGEYGLDNPAAVVEVYSGEGSEARTVSIGDPVQGRYYVKVDDRDAVFEIDSADVNMLTQNLFSLRDKRITSFEKDIIDAMEISLPDQMYVLMKEDTSDQWYMESPERKKAKKFKIDGMIDEFFWIKAKAFITERGVSRQKYGLDPPEADIVLKSEGSEILRIQIGKQLNDRQSYFFSVTRNQLCLIDNSSKERMVVPIEDILEEKN